MTVFPNDEYELHLPFFHRQRTHDLIESMADLESVTIYLGAGATVDRTGTDWTALISALLVEAVPDTSRRLELLRGKSPLELASAASETFVDRYGDEWRDRLSDAMRSRLYQQARSPAGKIVEQAVELSTALVDDGGSAALVTPNYDDFIFQEVQRRLSLPDTKIMKYARFFAGTPDSKVEPDQIHAVSEQLSRWKSGPNGLLVAYLHGILHGVRNLAIDGEPVEDAWPVLSERDYWRSAPMSAAVLTQLLQDRDVIIAGSSMSDAPLLNALLETQGSSSHHHKKVCILRIPPDLDRETRKYRIQLETRRLKHFGVQLVPVDHYGQVSQVFTEIDLRRRTEAPYVGSQSPTRYGSRLKSWWNSWLTGGGELHSRQRAHVKHLDRRLASLKDFLGSVNVEPMKLEVWLRWHPDRTRDLALWASTSAHWSDERTMRTASIEHDREVVAVQAFSAGTSVRVGGISNSRWQTYLATPVWIDAGYGAPLVIGVVSLASRWDQGSSSLGPGNATPASTALLEMHRIGVAIATPREM